MFPHTGNFPTQDFEGERLSFGIDGGGRPIIFTAADLVRALLGAFGNDDFVEFDVSLKLVAFRNGVVQ